MSKEYRGGAKYLSKGIMIVDNFKEISLVMDFIDSQIECENSFYDVQIIQRKKDLPNFGSNNRTYKSYCIRNSEHLTVMKEELVSVSELLKARIYINLNKRSCEDVMLTTMEETARRLKMKEYHKPHRIFNTCTGKSKGLYKVFIVDIDEGYNCEYSSFIKELGAKILIENKTLNGYHVIATPFNVGEFSKKYPDIDIHKNNPTLLYYKSV